MLLTFTSHCLYQEMPSGNGYSDILLLPNFLNPADIPMIIELKYNKAADSAISQIKDSHYPDIVRDYERILLVGISYDKDSPDKKHACMIEEWVK